LNAKGCAAINRVARTLALAAGLLICAPAPVWAQADTVALRDDIPLTYVVKKGDTLWDISALYLQEPWLWPKLWDSNPQVDNPHLIYPGDILALRWENGVPRLGLANRGEVKLSPSLRSEALDVAIPPIPRDEIDPFLRGNRVISPGEFERLPYLIAGDSGRLLSGLGDKVYGRGPMDVKERTYGVVRKGALITDPLTGEVLGQQVTDIGSVSLLTPPSTPIDDLAVKELEVTRTVEEARIGDRLLAVEAGIVDAYFQPKAPNTVISNGYMVAVDGGVTQIGQMDIVTINRGQREGLEVGDVLAIYQTGDVVKDPVTGDSVALPDVRAGVVMIFAAYEKASYGLVLSASRPLSVGDKVKNP